MEDWKSLSDWEEIFDNTEMYDEIKNTYKENFEKQQHRELNDTDEHLMRLSLLLQGWEESNDPQYEDADTPAKQAWSEFHNKMEQFREEDMEPHFTPEGFSKIIPIFTALKNLVGEFCTQEPKMAIKLTDYDQYKMFGDKNIDLIIEIPQNEIYFSRETCNELIKFENQYKVSFSMNVYIDKIIMRLHLKFENRIIYIKKQ